MLMPHKLKQLGLGSKITAITHLVSEKSHTTRTTLQRVGLNPRGGLKKNGEITKRMKI